MAAAGKPGAGGVPAVPVASGHSIPMLGLGKWRRSRPEPASLPEALWEGGGHPWARPGRLGGFGATLGPQPDSPQGSPDRSLLPSCPRWAGRPRCPSESPGAPPRESPCAVGWTLVPCHMPAARPAGERSPPSCPAAMGRVRVARVCLLRKLGSRVVFRADSHDRMNLTAPVELRSYVGISASVRHKGMVVDDNDEYLMQLSLTQSLCTEQNGLCWSKITGFFCFAVFWLIILTCNTYCQFTFLGGIFIKLRKHNGNCLF